VNAGGGIEWAGCAGQQRFDDVDESRAHVIDRDERAVVIGSGADAFRHDDDRSRAAGEPVARARGIAKRENARCARRQCTDCTNAPVRIADHRRARQSFAHERRKVLRATVTMMTAA